jgi:predicted Zn-dependent peptidase
MVFKGTERRDVEAIAQSLEAVGGNLDAYTTREHTCYSSYTLAEDLPLAVDVLGDLAGRPLLRPEHVAMEREVILEEIKSYEDAPDELIHDYLADTVWPGHALGRAVLGTPQSLERIGSAELAAYRGESYVGSRAVLVAAGDVDHDALVDLVRNAVPLPAGQPAVVPAPPSGYRPHFRRVTKGLAQEHLCLGSPGLRFSDPDRYALVLLLTLLGRGMSSRLFQRVREREGLAYAVYSYADFLQDAGLFGTYLAVSSSRTAEAVGVVLQEFERVMQEPVGEEELGRAKSQLKGNLLLDLERNTARAARLAMSEIYSSRFVPVDEIVSRIDALTADDVARAASRVLAVEDLSLVLHGPYEGEVPLPAALSPAE